MTIQYIAARSSFLSLVKGSYWFNSRLVEVLLNVVLYSVVREPPCSLALLNRCIWRLMGLFEWFIFSTPTDINLPVHHSEQPAPYIIQN